MREFRLLSLAVLFSTTTLWAGTPRSLEVVSSYPSVAASQALYDEMDYQRAVQAFVWAVPLVNSVGFSRALLAAGVSPTEPSLVIFDKRLTPRQVIMTANSEVIYAFGIVDLAKTGPTVVDAPDGVLGGIFDFWQRGLVDIGIGESRRGGRFLLLPPDYAGEVPSGFIVVRSKTKQVFVAGRGIARPGASTQPLVDKLSLIRLYPLSAQAAPPPTRIVLNGDRPFQSDWPKDRRYFDWMANALAYETSQPEDAVMYGMLKPLGIGPGLSFKPNARLDMILDRAAAKGSAMVSNLAFANRFGAKPVWPDRQWQEIIHATSPDFIADDVEQIDERASGWHQLVGNGIFIYQKHDRVPGSGIFYANAYRDKSGVFLSGTRSYRLRLPANPPARQFWSLTVYDVRTRSQIDTAQGRASLSSYSAQTGNRDGSIDITVGPHAPREGPGNWIQTIPGQGFFVMFRLYGPEASVYDGTWSLPDFEPVSKVSDTSNTQH